MKDKRPDKNPISSPPATKPYLAYGRRHGRKAFLVIVDGRSRLATGVVCNISSSPRARHRLKRTVLAKYLRAVADQPGDAR